MEIKTTYQIKCQKFSTSFKLVAGSKSILDYGKFLSMLKNHPDAANDSYIPPIYDGWFLTENKVYKQPKMSDDKGKLVAINLTEDGKILIRIIEKILKPVEVKPNFSYN